ncbi:hypothetical protein H5T51_03905 [Candidatus Bathyarchaeota archaeon]|nr:hypothetical protein [Candidatus Bathyarchaeota archaeon]
MTKKRSFIRFLKTYAVFWLFAIAVSVLFLEIVVGFLLVPERREYATEHGASDYSSTVFFGTAMFYGIFNFFGALIFHLKRFRPKRMGLLSLIAGFILEFSRVLQGGIQESEGSGAIWVQGWYNLNLSGETIMGTLISAAYWFVAWAGPTYIIYKFLSKGLEST